MDRFNTTYLRSYVVVSNGPGGLLLRVTDPALYGTYWKEFVSATAKVPSDMPIYIRLEQVPPEIVLTDQYSSFVPELPVATLEIGENRIPISSLISFNAPNTEVPGLYRIDYRIALPGKTDVPIWSSYVSVQQRPVLRSAAGGWVRDSYIIKTLNRLVMEPQFMEALHAAGDPLYGFMEMNQHPSIRAASLGKYGGVQAWGVPCFHENGIFITGPRLPQGTIVIYQKRMLQLQEPAWPSPPDMPGKMSASSHKITDDTYNAGVVVRVADTSYICIRRTEKVVTEDTDHWARGYLYRFSVLNGDSSFALAPGPLSLENGLEHIWATVDSQGYSFWVDIAHTTSLGVYRGHYDKKYVADYATGDIVSYVAENSIRLYSRKATDIPAPETLIYPPGHHRNPAWEEIYAWFQDSNTYSPLMGNYYVVPHSNATNAIMSKTWSVSEEMCQAFARMVGIPDIIVKECGAKWSALLFALLSRTRNTFEGIRLCLRAVGLDIKNLRLSQPSLAYYCTPDVNEERVEDVFAQHANLRSLLSHIDTLAPVGQETCTDGSLRYVTEDNDPNHPEYAGVAIQQWSEAEGQWITRYRFERMEPSQNYNNRYYKADLDVLARLASDAVIDLGDGKTWVKETAWSGMPSAVASACLKYEVPIYIWLVLKINLYAENRIGMKGSVYSGVTDKQRCGAKNIIELFPSKYYSRAAHDFVEIPTGVYEYVHDAWTEITPTAVNDERGSRIYEFDTVKWPIRIRAKDPDSGTFIRYWQSTCTTGLLGLPESPATENPVPYTIGGFHNVTDPAVTDESDLMLANGYVGVTALYAPKDVHIAGASSRSWKYILDGSWQFAMAMPFTEFEEVPFSDIYSFEGPLSELKGAMMAVTDSPNDTGHVLHYEWDNDTLVLYDCAPSSIYLRDGAGTILAAYDIGRTEHSMTPEDWGTYAANKPSVRIRLGV